jgi:hypothetical protein
MIAQRFLHLAFFLFATTGSLIVLLTAFHFGPLWLVNTLFVVWFCSLVTAGVLFIQINKRKKGSQEL